VLAARCLRRAAREKALGVLTSTSRDQTERVQHAGRGHSACRHLQPSARESAYLIRSPRDWIVHHRDRGASSSVVAAEPRDHWAAHIIRMGAPSCDPAPTPRGDAARHPWAAPRCSVVLPLRRAVVLSSERGRSVSIGATSLMRRCPLRDGAVTVVRYTVGLAVVATHGGGVIVRVA
jgi:hypothetical protein